MSNYRRNYVPGGTYFFTLVTYQRQHILTSENARLHLRRAIEEVRRNRPFQLVAIVLLTDHLHTIWTLPPSDSDYSIRWGLIKSAFSREYLQAGGTEGELTENQRKHRQRAVWQHRFWEHTITDENDLKNCLDYIHWNPVKHGLANLPREYPWSSFQGWVEKGEYAIDWGDGEQSEVPGAEWD